MCSVCRLVEYFSSVGRKVCHLEEEYKKFIDSITGAGESYKQARADLLRLRLLHETMKGTLIN
jgi:hypothetical protein